GHQLANRQRTRSDGAATAARRRRRGDRVKRRDLIALLGSIAVAMPYAARAQKPMPVIGFLGATSPGPSASLVAAFRQALGDAGYIEGQNVGIEYRWAQGRYDLLPALAADLVGHKVRVIVCAGGPPPALAAKSATSTVPIVFVVDDPVVVGLVAGLARPGGNLTGVALMNSELVPKRLELLTELVPQARVIALLVHPHNQTVDSLVAAAQSAARAKGVPLPILKASTEGEIDAAFATLGQLYGDALLVGDDPFFYGRREQLVALAARYAVPTIYGREEFAASGGLVSYGTSLAGTFSQAGVYAGKILKGAKP